MTSFPSVCVCILSAQLSENIGLSNLIETVVPSVRIIYVLGKKPVTHFKYSEFNLKIHFNEHSYYQPRDSIVMKIIGFIYSQIKITFDLIRILPDVEIVFFYMGSNLTLPALIAKIFGRKILIISTGSLHKCTRQNQRFIEKLFAIITSSLERNTQYLANRIIVYGNSYIHHAELERYLHKIIIAPKHFISVDTFKPIKKISERTKLIGFIGRLGLEKGILNFVDAIIRLQKTNSDLNFVIIGSGPLENELITLSKRLSNPKQLRMIPAIPHDDIPFYLNELYMLVLPSYSEGLPNIILEAMACGTPVLVTSVGALPDVVKDNETGFIIKTNSPVCIAEGILRVIAHSDLERITANARTLIENEFTYLNAVKRYKQLFNDID